MSLWDNDITTDSRPYVMELQSYLRTIQRDRFGATTVPLDGFFGADTAAGISQFQTAVGLPRTGTVNQETWEALVDANRETQTRLALPLFIRGLRVPLLQPGDGGDAVVFLNVMLDTPGTVYTTATEEAVRQIQKNALLPITGNTDKDTWDAVVRLYNWGVFRE